jgi:hypothetical protein
MNQYVIIPGRRCKDLHCHRRALADRGLTTSKNLAMSTHDGSKSVTVGSLAARIRSGCWVRGRLHPSRPPVGIRRE